MAITRWSPMSPLRSLRSLEKEFDDLFSAFGLPSRWEEGRELEWAPPADIVETKDNYQIDLEMPGMNKEDVKINLTNDVLTIQGEKKMEQSTKEGNVHRTERSYGTFMRSFRLPGAVDTDKVKAEYKNGILHMTIPKAEGAKSKQIQIQ